MRLELTKHGKNSVGMWALGTLVNDNFEFSGLFNLSNDYKLVDGSIYEVSDIKMRLDKKGILRITLALK